MTRIPPPDVPVPPPRLPGSLNVNRRLDRWLRILPEGIIEVMPGKVEIGQGIVTALAQIAAEELDVDLARIRMVRARTGSSPDEAVTSGSQSVQECGTALRHAGAEARALLVAEAARQWDADPATLQVNNGVINDASGRTLAYWQLDSAALFDREASGQAAPKAAAAHRLVGTAVERLDIPDKIYGRPRFVQDMALPGMRYGRVLRPAAPGARLQSLDDSAARALPGVVVVRDGSFAGVVAEREEIALKAVALLRKGAVWSEGAGLPPTVGLHDWMRTQPLDTKVIEDKRAAAPARLVRDVSLRYTKPYLAHASIGACCAVAQWTDGRLAVYSHSQGIYNLRADLGIVFSLPVTDITIEHVEGAGCYGHNGADDVALDAALLARGAAGHPVQVVWSREEELAWSPHSPAMDVQIKAGLDEQGNVLTWNYEVWSNGHGIRPGRAKIPTLLAARYLEKPYEQFIAVNAPLANGGGAERNAIALYDFPEQVVTNHRLLTMPLRVSAMRALGGYANIFAIESAMDELALQAGADPVEYRLRHMKDERAIAVLKNAAARARWSAWDSEEHEEGAGHGIAWVKYKNTGAYCAVVAEVVMMEVVKAKRLVIAVDVGLTINPDGVINQIEGGAVQAASWTLKEAVGYDGERITATDWEQYPILNFSEVPAVEVEIINRPDERAVGAGEAASGPTAAAIANAVAHALGVRVRDLPLTPERIMAAM
ncbi:MAG TPA: molybdopterin cofactor-binding domain-containing protein [Burkholderiales bacterium]|nr:molybdopterin cofactor-binding domain-containing protein [Burkholderiales bacterium]